MARTRFACWCSPLLLVLVLSFGTVVCGQEEAVGDAVPGRTAVTGRLARVRTTKGNEGYALFDAAGKMVHPVVPATDLSLEPYLGEHVVLVGKSSTTTPNRPAIFHATEVARVPGAATDTAGAEAASGVQLAALNDNTNLEELQPPRTPFSPTGPTSVPAITPIPAPTPTTVMPSWEIPGITSGLDVQVPDVSSMIPGMSRGPRSPTYVIWGRAEYLLWWPEGMNLPPLVTSSPAGTPASQVGILGEPTTSILYGNGNVLEDPVNGVRLKTGLWIDQQTKLGVEGEYLQIFKEDFGYNASSNFGGLPILARPFFNMNPRNPATNAFAPPARDDAEIVAYPGIATGAMSISGSSELYNIGLRGLINLGCRDTATPAPCCNRFFLPGKARTDIIVGYRYTQLKEALSINESLFSLDPDAPGEFSIADRFSTDNQFNGVDLGFMWQYQYNRITLEMLAKVAVGLNSWEVDISGSTTNTPIPGGPSDTFNGGLLAQRTNIGSYSESEFAVIPELGAQFGIFLTQRLQFTVGYTLIYMTPIYRPGDQIDLDLNPDLFPPENVPFAGALRPSFTARENDFWVQGVSVGLDYRF